MDRVAGKIIPGEELAITEVFTHNGPLYMAIAPNLDKAVIHEMRSGETEFMNMYRTEEGISAGDVAQGNLLATGKSVLTFECEGFMREMMVEPVVIEVIREISGKFQPQGGARLISTPSGRTTRRTICTPTTTSAIIEAPGAYSCLIVNLRERKTFSYSASRQTCTTADLRTENGSCVREDRMWGELLTYFTSAPQATIISQAALSAIREIERQIEDEGREA